jgi:hypothetical protein
MDRPDLVPDRDALTCRGSLLGMVASKGWYCSIFPLILERFLTMDEREEIWSKITGYHPVRWEDTWGAAIERIEQHRQANPDFNPWRSQV